MLVEEKMLLMAQRSRQNYMERMGPLLAAKQTEVEITERSLPTAAGETLVLIYKPCGSPVKPWPVYLNIHGGGFIQGSTQDDDGWCRQIAAAAGCVVVNIEYHLAPEHKFPLQLEECYDVIKWVQATADENGFDPSQIAIGGSSAGANFAAALCLMARQRQDVALCYQVLNYPPLDFLTDPETKGDRDPLLTARAQAFFTACYLRDLADAANPLASPLLADSLAGLPPALIITAELDPLCDEDERYAKRLAADGVAVTYQMFAGCSHAFTHMGPEPVAMQAWELIQTKLKQAFTSDAISGGKAL
jgi:acetyl esterase